MNSDQLEEFRKRLTQERDAVANEVNAHSASVSKAADEVEVEVAIIESDENLIAKIEFALKQIDDGSYGTCVECQNAIPIERLEAKPAVSLCTACQEAKERNG